MTPVEDLAELATIATRAATGVRAAGWRDPQQVQRTIQELSSRLADEKELAERPLVPVNPSPAKAAAIAAATEARIAVYQAEIAALRAIVAVPVEGAGSGPDTAADTAADAGAAAAPGTGPGRTVQKLKAHPVTRHYSSLVGGAAAELAHIVRSRPRDIAFRLAISLGFGLGYLVFFAIFLWDPDRHERSFLALYAFSGIAGSAICTNALSVDAARVRGLLEDGRPLWYVMVTKNAALGVIVGALGTIMNLIVFWESRDVTDLIKGSALLLTMLFLWFGVGNVLSVISPLRAEPLSARRNDGTLRPFLFSFVVSYGLSYLVNLMLYWRVWAKQTLLERLGGVWIPVLLIVCSAIGVYVLLTVLSLTLVEQPRYRRGLQREMVSYRKSAESASADAGD
ncbi:hypothetical protein [Nakamurella lactea]|uniref:hypothetical protein n=1 Tax=Nakamurella lactea TaxID=459515 RepID=UPI0003FF3028|nr:hypothetical protein [Nakamurella lactea]